MLIYLFILPLAYIHTCSSMEDEELYASIISVQLQQSTCLGQKIPTYKAVTQYPHGKIFARQHKIRDDNDFCVECIFIPAQHKTGYVRLPDIFLYRLRALHEAMRSIDHNKNNSGIYNLPKNQHKSTRRNTI
jgi:hypothetical protein